MSMRCGLLSGVIIPRLKLDRKSTRLNSSHLVMSYAVFCLKERQLGKQYASVSALHGIDLDIASGELIALLGPSGSGKTALLRAIAGLDPIDSGRILCRAIH